MKKGFYSETSISAKLSALEAEEKREPRPVEPRELPDRWRLLIVEAVSPIKEQR